MDFQSEHERYLCHILGDQFIAVTHYPAAIKAFYMEPDTTDPTKVQSFDILGPIEFVGGSIRKYRPDVLAQTMRDRGMAFDVLKFYTDLRETGTMPHGGFGLGFARLVAWVCSLSSIHDVPQFPRAAGSCRF
jgi:asparaginyl-tRNA synthetase